MKIILWIAFLLILAWMMSRKRPIPKGAFFNKIPIHFESEKLRWISAYVSAAALVGLVANMKQIMNWLVEVARNNS